MHNWSIHYEEKGAGVCKDVCTMKADSGDLEGQIWRLAAYFMLVMRNRKKASDLITGLSL